MLKPKVSKVYDCNMKTTLEDGMMTVYKLTPPKRNFQYTINYETPTKVVMCSYKKL